ncbi:hypothetical protein ACS0TY_002020 [Phlomoides rotata]
MGEQHQKGKFPSTTKMNPREHCKAIKLRSGTRYDGPSKSLEEELELVKEDEEDKGIRTKRERKKEQEEMNEKPKKDESAQ